MSTRVGAVVVLYRADAAEVRGLLEAVRAQVDRVVLVANGPSGRVDLAWDELASEGGEPVRLELEENLGLAAAQNEGLRWLLAEGHGRLLLLDQDSRPGPSMVARLEEALDAEENAVAAGPRYHDRRTGQLGYFVRWSWTGVQRVEPGPGSQPVSVDFLIASGSLLRAEALREVGFMDEELFIDHIDTEWCLRATHAGRCLLGVGEARLEHAIGGEVRRIWLGRWRHVSHHSPLRLYFNLRNSLLLWPRPWVSWRWRCADFWRIMLRLAYFGIFDPERAANWPWLLRAVRDGLAGRGGPPEVWDGR